MTTAPVPGKDGEVNIYNLGGSGRTQPRIYFVNGMRVLPIDHALIAARLSLYLQSPVYGIYNSSARHELRNMPMGSEVVGSALDGLQCVPDWLQNATARLSSFMNTGKEVKLADADVPRFLQEIEEKSIVWNQATVSLFKELVWHRNEDKYIIAHSQGNLITSNALFVFEDVLGAIPLERVRVYSLASPSPAWPLGLRHTRGGGGRQDNAYMNDFVALLRPHNLAAKLGVTMFQNEGDFRTHAGSPAVGLTPHDTSLIIESLNFIPSIRDDLGMPKYLTAAELEAIKAIDARVFPNQ